MARELESILQKTRAALRWSILNPPDDRALKSRYIAALDGFEAASTELSQAPTRCIDDFLVCLHSDGEASACEQTFVASLTDDPSARSLFAFELLLHGVKSTLGQSRVADAEVRSLLRLPWQEAARTLPDSLAGHVRWIHQALEGMAEMVDEGFVDPSAAAPAEFVVDLAALYFGLRAEV